MACHVLPHAYMGYKYFHKPVWKFHTSVNINCYSTFLTNASKTLFLRPHIHMVYHVAYCQLNTIGRTLKIFTQLGT